MDPRFWDHVNNVGLRNYYFCNVYAARMMIPRKQGLIVVTSSLGGVVYLLNVPYGVGKAACDRLAGDSAVELRKYNITSISLWPGAARTEVIMNRLRDRGFDKIVDGPNAKLKRMFEEGETAEFSGLAVVHLAADKHRLQKTGKILITSDLADEYGYKDTDGRRPPNFRSLKEILKHNNWDRLAWLIPAWIKIPGCLITAWVSML